MEASRRQFFGLLGAALAGATLDPERLLWKPGQRSIFLPAVKALRDPATGIAIRLVRHWDPVTSQQPTRLDCYWVDGWFQSYANGQLVSA